MNIHRKKLGLALGSGGVRGLAHIGVLKVFIQNNIPIDFIAGSSIGAWVAAHYALYRDIESLTEVTAGKKWEKLLTFLEPGLKGGLIRGNKKEQFLRKFFVDSDFLDTQIPLQIVATDLANGLSVVFSEGKIAPAVRASMAVPTLFKPPEYQGKIFVDGGIANPVPDDIVRKMGADVVVAVNLNNISSTEKLSKDDLTLMGVTMRSLDIMRYHLAQYCLKSSDIIIEPPIVYAGLKSWRQYFTRELGSDYIKIGEEETKKIIPQLLDLLK